MKIKLNTIDVTPTENIPVLMVNEKDYVGVVVYSEGYWKTVPGNHTFAPHKKCLWISFTNNEDEL